MLSSTDIDIIKHYPRNTRAQLELKRLTRKLQYFQTKIRKVKMQDRKQDARQKIMMGGLIIKAGLEDIFNENPAIILGLLLEAKDKLDTSDKAKQLEYWQKLGLQSIIKF